MNKLTNTEIKKSLTKLETGWNVIHNDHLERDYKFPDFKKALKFVNEVGKIAETQDHHPDIELKYGSVKLRIWTHSVGGLSEKDFKLASKIDDIL